MIPVIWHHNDSFWDCAFPKWILNRSANCAHMNGISYVPMVSGRIGVIVIPGRHSCNELQYDHLSDAGGYFKKVIYVIIGDEEGIFHSDKLKHPNMKIWWFMPPFHPKQKVDRVAPNGWPTDAQMFIDRGKKETFGSRTIDWSFLGQMTHSRRVECVNATQQITGPHYSSHLVTTPGFTQGEPRDKYYSIMTRSKLVLCPSGPCTPDSFRFAEALEAGCVPIVDNLTQDPTYPEGYWNYLFGEGSFPFPVISDWSTLPLIVDLYLHDWEARAKECKVWWKAQKDRLVLEMQEDLRE